MLRNAVCLLSRPCMCTNPALQRSLWADCKYLTVPACPVGPISCVLRRCKFSKAFLLPPSPFQPDCACLSCWSYELCLSFLLVLRTVPVFPVGPKNCACRAANPVRPLFHSSVRMVKVAFYANVLCRFNLAAVKQRLVCGKAHTHTFACVHTHTQIHMNANTHKPKHTHARARPHTHPNTQTHTRTCTHTHPNTQTHIHTCTHTLTHIHTQARTHTRTYTHAPACACAHEYIHSCWVVAVCVH